MRHLPQARQLRTASEPLTSEPLMQTLDQALASIHPDTLTGALFYFTIVVMLGVLGTIAIRSAAKRALRRDRVDPMVVTFGRGSTRRADG